MKAVMMSIQPKWCELIVSGIKTVEVRKTRPKLESPFKCYIYETKAKDHYAVFHENTIGKVIGEFVCSNIAKGTSQFGSCLTMQEIAEYANNKEVYGWCISDLVIYDEPKELNEFCVTDNFAIQSCKHREITGQPEYKTAHNGWIKGSYICNVNGEPDWCTKCKTKPLKRPPQPWCYVEELK